METDTDTEIMLSIEQRQSFHYLRSGRSAAGGAVYSPCVCGFMLPHSVGHNLNIFNTLALGFPKYLATDPETAPYSYGPNYSPFWP